MGDWVFKDDIVDAHLAGASVTKTATLLGESIAAVSKVIMTYTSWDDIISEEE